MRQAFPKPAASAERALKKYVGVLEGMLTKSLQFARSPIQLKQDWYAISLQLLANNGGQIGPNKIRVHKWLRENNLALVETLEQGSAIAGRVSEIKLSKWVTAVNTLAVQGSVIATKTTDQALDDYLTGDPADNHALFNHLYPDYRKIKSAGLFDEVFDPLPVDVASLKAYIVWLSDSATKINAAEKAMALRQAKTILGAASVFNNVYLQRRKPSDFGRIYYEGTSIQNVNKELRRAVLGNCWEYDIRSSVTAWKMGFARSYLQDNGLDLNIKAHFPWSLLYLEEKADFMATVRHYVFNSHSPVPKDLQAALLKQAFTAISFGARQSGTGWLDPSGHWHNPALVEIIKNADDRARFLADPCVQGFIKEQNTLDDYLFAKFKKHRPLLCNERYLQTDSGRLSKAKVMAYLYQHDETAVMNIVVQAAQVQGRAPIARVHDAIFFKTRLGADLKDSIEWQMREQTGNPYWHLTPEQLQRYQPMSLNAQREEQEHRSRIAEQERLAKGYVPKWPELFGQDQPDR